MQTKKQLQKAITDEAVKTANYDSIDAKKPKMEPHFVFMGHGTSHVANVSYDQMQTQIEQLGYKNVFIGTVEGEPEDTECQAVIEKIKEAGYKKVSSSTDGCCRRSRTMIWQETMMIHGRASLKRQKHLTV